MKEIDRLSCFAFCYDKANSIDSSECLEKPTITYEFQPIVWSTLQALVQF